MQVSVGELISKYLSEQFSVSSLKNYAHHPNMKIYKKYEVIFREGEAVESVFLLYQGEVMMVKKREHSFCPVVESFQPGEILGLPAVLSGVAHNTTVIAKSKVHVFKVFKEELVQFLADHPCFYLAVAEKLSKKLLYYEAILSK